MKLWKMVVTCLSNAGSFGAGWVWDMAAAFNEEGGARD